MGSTFFQREREREEEEKAIQLTKTIFKNK